MEHASPEEDAHATRPGGRGAPAKDEAQEHTIPGEEARGLGHGGAPDLVLRHGRAMAL